MLIIDFYYDARRAETQVYLSDLAGGRRYTAKPKVLEFEEAPLDTDVEPWLRLGRHASFTDALLAGLLRFGIKLPENLELKGKLEAQGLHVAFLEELVREHWGKMA